MSDGYEDNKSMIRADVALQLEVSVSRMGMEVFDFPETRNENAQVERMVCTDPGQQSTCNDIHRGDGVPGREGVCAPASVQDLIITIREEVCTHCP